MTREDWLNKLKERLRPLFARAEMELPENIRISCGWPVGRALATPSSPARTIGQCWTPACSADGHYEIFVSPVLEDPMHVASTLVHELCHVIDECESGHGAEFARLCRAIGLEGKPTHTHAGPELTDRLNAIIGAMPAYPHATLDKSVTHKKQTTRMIKIRCAKCGYTARTTAQWLATGTPTCVCGHKMRASYAKAKGDAG